MVKKLPTIVQRAIIIFVTALMVMCMFSTTAYAADEADEGSGQTEYITVGDNAPPTAQLRSALNYILNSMNGNIGGNANIEANAIMAPQSTLWKVWNDNEDNLKQFYDIIFAVGVNLTLMYFLVYLQKEVAEGRVTMDTLAKACVKLLMVFWLMMYGFDIMEAFIEIGGALGQEILNKSGEMNLPTAFVGQEFVDNINATKGKIWIILTLVVSIFELLIPWLVTNIMMLFIQVQAYMRMIELFIRAMFAPLALGDIYSGGPNPTALRYLRGFLACSLQGVIIIGVLFVYRMISSSIASNVGIAGILGNAVVLAAAVGFIGKSNTFAKELCCVG